MRHLLLAVSLLALPLAAPAAPKAQRVELKVTGEGFVPAEVKIKKGQPVELVVTRTTEKTCATQIVIKDAGISKDLPLDKPVTVAFTPEKSGKLRYACAMDMIAGVLVVE